MNAPWIRRRPNYLAFPGINPSFDPTHFAAGIPRFSAVATGNGSFFSLLNANVGTLMAGTPAAAMHGIIGPVTNMGNLGQINYPGHSNAIDTASSTIAGILLFTASTGNQWIFGTGTSSGMSLLIANTRALQFFNGGFSVSSLLITVGVPYLIIGSISSVAANFLLLNLQRGSIVTSTTTGLSISTPSGSYIVGANPISAGASNEIAAVMYSVGFLSIPEMIQWAQDPWSYWYPNTISELLTMGVSAPGVLPLQGTLGNQIFRPKFQVGW